jgi:hypothetical protein
MSYTKKFKETTASTGAAEWPVLLLEIVHSALAEPIRLARDTLDLTHLGNVYTAMHFDAAPPEDLEEGEPRAALSVDNVGKELTQWLEASGGGRGATVRMIQVLRSDPDVVEWDVTMDLADVNVDLLRVEGRLGFDSLIHLPAVALSYRPDTAPGVF